MFNELSKQEDTMKKMLADSENKGTLAMLENSGILKKLNSLPEEQRASVIEKIGESLEGISPEISKEGSEIVDWTNGVLSSKKLYLKNYRIYKLNYYKRAL